MTDILKEISYDQSDEKKLYFFKKILPITVIVTLVIIIFMIVMNKQQEKIDDDNIRLSDALVKSIGNKDDKEIEKLLQTIIETGHKSRIVELAHLKMVGLKIKQQDLTTAKQILQDIMHNNTYLSLTQSFARVAWLSMIIDEVNLSEQDKNQVQQCFKYFKGSNQEFFVEAMILKALWYEKNNQIDLAKATLQDINNIEKLPQITQEQIKALISKFDIKS